MSQITVEPISTRYHSICSSKFPIITEDTSERPLNTTVKTRIDEIEENNNYLNTLTLSYKDKFPLPKKKTISFGFYNSHKILDSNKLRFEEKKKSSLIPKSHRKILSCDDDKRIKKPVSFKIITEEKKPKKHSSSQNNINNVNYKTFKDEVVRHKINKISSCEGSSLTKFNVFKSQLSKTLSKLSTPIKNINKKFFQKIAPLTEVLSRKYKSKHVFIYSNNNFLTDELRTKDILCQYNQISKIAPVDIYKLRKELCFQMGLNLIEKENEIGFERRYKKNMSYVTPKWVEEYKLKQKQEMKLINGIREKTKNKFENILKSKV